MLVKNREYFSLWIFIIHSQLFSVIHPRSIFFSSFLSKIHLKNCFLHTHEYTAIQWNIGIYQGPYTQNNTNSLCSGNIKLLVAPYTGELVGWLWSCENIIWVSIATACSWVHTVLDMYKNHSFSSVLRNLWLFQSFPILFHDGSELCGDWCDKSAHIYS